VTIIAPGPVTNEETLSIVFVWAQDVETYAAAGRAVEVPRMGCVECERLRAFRSGCPRWVRAVELDGEVPGISEEVERSVLASRPTDHLFSAHLGSFARLLLWVLGCQPRDGFHSGDPQRLICNRPTRC
jgi:hypothetical protein